MFCVPYYSLEGTLVKSMSLALVKSRQFYATMGRVVCVLLVPKLFYQKVLNS